MAEATKALRAAMRANVHMVPMLLGDAPLPDELPDTYGIGDEDEAAPYVHSSTSTWYDAVGSIEWLAEVSRTTPAGGTGRRKRR